jgi:hypothetical protein
MINESEKSQLGEPAISVLAIRFREFVSVYNRFMNLWDLDHGVIQNEVTGQILKAHGKCDEVENLLMDFVVNHRGDCDLVQHVLRSELTEIW